MMVERNLSNVLSDMKEMKRYFTNCRAYFPFIPPNQTGSNQIITAPYYMNKGFTIVLNYENGLMDQDREENNDVAHWINQNLIVRLYSILEYYQVVSDSINIDKNIKGWEEVEILRRLRNVFAHKSGKYNKNDNDERKLVEKIICKYGLTEDNPDDFPLDIDKVLDPIYNGCAKYTETLYKQRVV